MRRTRPSLLAQGSVASGTAGLLACLILAIFYLPTEAQAHAHPINESPAPLSVVRAPAVATIVFDDALESELSQITVIDHSGQSVTPEKSTVDPAHPKTMTLPLPLLSPGTFEVKWTAVAKDGHRTQGSYRFSVK